MMEAVYRGQGWPRGAASAETLKNWAGSPVFKQKKNIPLPQQQAIGPLGRQRSPENQIGRGIYCSQLSFPDCIFHVCEQYTPFTLVFPSRVAGGGFPPPGSHRTGLVDLTSGSSGFRGGDCSLRRNRHFYLSYMHVSTATVTYWGLQFLHIWASDLRPRSAKYAFRKPLSTAGL
jgi:hypothetical protein